MANADHSKHILKTEEITAENSSQVLKRVNAQLFRFNTCLQ